MDPLEKLLPEKVYHLFNHANGDENLFKSDENYFYFLKQYGEYISPIAETYAYCLLPNHFHFMLKFKTASEILNNFKANNSKIENFETLEEFSKFISQQFSNLFNGYTQAFNKMYERKGSLFMPRFKRKIVENEAYYKKLIAYIHLNPVHHGFCKNLLDWNFSSIHSYYQSKTSKIDKQFFQEYVGDKEKLLAYHNSLKVEDLKFDF